MILAKMIDFHSNRLKTLKEKDFSRQWLEKIVGKEENAVFFFFLFS